MTAEAIGLWISVISLLLGIISAWTQIKYFLLKIAKIGNHAARSWSIRDQEVTKTYLENPSILIAYLGKSAISATLLFISLSFIKPTTIRLLYDVSERTAEYISLAPPCFIGLLLGAIFNRCSSIIDMARDRQ